MPDIANRAKSPARATAQRRIVSENRLFTELSATAPAFDAVPPDSLPSSSSLDNEDVLPVVSADLHGSRTTKAQGLAPAPAPAPAPEAAPAPSAAAASSTAHDLVLEKYTLYETKTVRPLACFLRRGAQA